MRVRIIDAFTAVPFAGNPAAVCLLDADAWPDETWMRQVAAELNQPMTAFAYPLRDAADPHAADPEGADAKAADAADADWALRWFTPLVEEKLCGHATLATAHALHSDRGTPGAVRFSTRSGVLVARSGHDRTITLDFPAAAVTEVSAPAGLAEALGGKPDATYGTGALGDLVAVFPEEGTVRALAPDFTALAEVTRRDGIRGVTVTAAASNPDRGYDFVSRFFSPADGVPEDPVTGSAHTALAPYWSHRLGRDDLVGLQASTRTGLVGAAVRGDRVHLTGQAVTVLDGVLHHTAGSGSAAPRFHQV